MKEINKDQTGFDPVFLFFSFNIEPNNTYRYSLIYIFALDKKNRKSPVN